jgi:DNA-binding FadR family transcriptional regulator
LGISRNTLRERMKRLSMAEVETPSMAGQKMV